ncbi:Subunit of heteropentameric Replication factor C (RF-C) [Clydaea vesicula]|uniref:Replication factor C subunit 5 n=1 Tax=Clydaea vesicula TaxID=447962 RepID=A0AAD5TZU2_9FUNG|nr:Subunit of heteropentameric Replication factor C (RF-C) [Clydaea vesicula]KAJ3379525.1 Subunit of heteropentameric Replication factor C (RF-C) [Lobulomyces angularis]
MSLYVDKHRPSELKQLTHSKSLTSQLMKLGSSLDLPHLLIYGPSGVGKKTRILALLKQIFGNSVEKIKIDQRVFQTPAGKRLELVVCSSNYHIEITPSDVGIYDRVVVQDLIKELAQTQQVDVNSKRSFKVVVINEAHNLSKDAQHGLRRTMEKYMGNLRVILCSNSTSRILSPIRSRCLLIRVASPSINEICDILFEISEKECLNLPEKLSQRIAVYCNGNLRRALLILECLRVKQFPLSSDMEIVTTDWEDFLESVALMIVEEQSPQRLLLVRGKLYEALAHCIPAEVILKTLTLLILEKIDDNFKVEFVKEAALYDHRLRLGTKHIMHLEAFVAKFMTMYKKYLVELMSDF